MPFGITDFIAPDFNPGIKMDIDCDKCRRYGRSGIGSYHLHNPHKTSTTTKPSFEMDRANGTKIELLIFTPD